MKKEYHIQFCFKGNRKYVQGPDIFDAIINIVNSEFQNISNIKYIAYKMLHTNAILTITDLFVKSDYKDINSIVSFMQSGKKIYAVISQNDEDINCSTEYSEEIVQKYSSIQNETIVFKNILKDSLSEIIVSMNKHYLNKIIPKEGKWIVTKFEYIDLVQQIDDSELKLELIQNLNNKLTKSKIYINKTFVGFLYFSLIEEGNK